MIKRITALAIFLCSLSLPAVAQLQMEPDKKLHFGAGIIIGAGSYFIFPEVEEFIFDRNFISPALWSITMAGIAGAGKEVVYDDMMGRGTPDIYDFYYTLAGGFVSGITLAVCESIFRTGNGCFAVDINPAAGRISFLCSFKYAN